MVSLLGKLKGMKTYFAAAGLIGLACYQFSTGQIPLGFHSLLAGLAAAGLRGAISDIKA